MNFAVGALKRREQQAEKRGPSSAPKLAPGCHCAPLLHPWPLPKSGASVNRAASKVSVADQKGVLGPSLACQVRRILVGPAALRRTKGGGTNHALCGDLEKVEGDPRQTKRGDEVE